MFPFYLLFVIRSKSAYIDNIVYVIISMAVNRQYFDKCVFRVKHNKIQFADKVISLPKKGYTAMKHRYKCYEKMCSFTCLF